MFVEASHSGEATVYSESAHASPAIGGKRAAAAQESSWLSSFEEEDALRPARPVLGRASEAAIIALHRPAAV